MHTYENSYTLGVYAHMYLFNGYYEEYHDQFEGSPGPSLLWSYCGRCEALNSQNSEGLLSLVLELQGLGSLDFSVSGWGPGMGEVLGLLRESLRP